MLPLSSNEFAEFVIGYISGMHISGETILPDTRDNRATKNRAQPSFSGSGDSYSLPGTARIRRTQLGPPLPSRPLLPLGYRYPSRCSIIACVNNSHLKPPRGWYSPPQAPLVCPIKAAQET